VVVGVRGVLEQRRPKADISKYCTLPICWSSRTPMTNGV